MKSKLAIAFSAICLFFVITGAQAVTVSSSDMMTVIRGASAKIQCVGGRRCTGYYTDNRGVRVCRGWVACR